MLLPFYTTDFVRWRDVAAVCAALAFIVFLFWHLNLHYMNVLFAASGYREFTLSPVADANALSGKTTQVLITRRTELSSGEHLVAYRLSDTVYFEANACLSTSISKPFPVSSSALGEMKRDTNFFVV